MNDHSALIERLDEDAAIFNECEEMGEPHMNVGALLAEAAAALRDQQRRLDMWEPKPFCEPSWSSGLPSTPNLKETGE